MAWQEPPWYGPVCQVVWEDGGGNPASYPIGGGDIRAERVYLVIFNATTLLPE